MTNGMRSKAGLLLGMAAAMSSLQSVYISDAEQMEKKIKTYKKDACVKKNRAKAKRARKARRKNR